MCRLARLLHHFKLAPTATSADLRQAYLKRVKEVHPDVVCPFASSRGGVGRGAVAEFHKLQEHYQEATELLSASEQHLAAAAAQGQTGHQQPPRQWGPPGAGVGAASGTGYYAGEPAGAGGRSGLPCNGLPQTTVYPFAAASVIAAAAASFALTFREQNSPAVAQQLPRPAQTVAGAAAAPAPAVASTAPPPKDVASFPVLKPGAWNVSEARAEKANKGTGVWAPSKSDQFLDSDSFYTGRAKGHLRAGIGQRRRIGDKQGAQIKDLGYEAAHEPLERDGVEMLPVHAAAADGDIWFLERCGATKSCRAMLEIGDAVKDTPLHHCARSGQESACKALLRLTMVPDAKNGQDKLPEELVAEGARAEVTALLRTAREAGQGHQIEEALRHPDGLGALQEPPEQVVFVGIREAEVLRHAVNMAAGFDVTPPIPMARSETEGAEARAMRAADVVRGSLQGTEFEVEDVAVEDGERQNPWAVGAKPDQVISLQCRGLLVYEPPGAVSATAPGHFVALRQEDPSVGDGAIWRLDPVRGPFRMTSQESEELLGRYRAWRVIQGPGHLREERAKKLAMAMEEAAAIQRRKGPASGVAAA